MYKLEPIYSEENKYVLYTPDGKQIEVKTNKNGVVKPKDATCIEWEAIKRLKRDFVVYEQEEERLDLDI
jgi:hypothetical protein